MRRWLILFCIFAFIIASTPASSAKSWRTESRYPLTKHYYTPKDPATAGMLSTVFPGMGQIYAGSPGKGLVFLFAEATLITAAIVQIDRALYYDDQADNYDLFYDSETNSYMTYEQGYNRARGHGIFGAGLILASAGLHLWNVQDAVHTANRYNRARRLTFEVRTLPEPQFAAHVRF